MFDYLCMYIIIITGLLLSWQVYRKCRVLAIPVLLLFCILADPRLHWPKVYLVTLVLRPLGIWDQVARSRIFDAVWTLLPAVVVALLAVWIAAGLKRLGVVRVQDVAPETHHGFGD